MARNEPSVFCKSRRRLATFAFAFEPIQACADPKMHTTTRKTTVVRREIDMVVSCDGRCYKKRSVSFIWLLLQS